MDAHDTRWAIGIDLGGTKTEALLLGADGREHWRQRVATPTGTYEDIVDMLCGLVDTARHQAGGARPTLGIGGPGALTHDGRLKNANTTRLNGRRLTDDLAARLGQPVRYANDANCLALSEATDGAAAGADVVFAAILGTGTGAGIAIGGRVLDGPNRLAGEWGHNPLPWRRTDCPDAEPLLACYCGRQGCVETLVSGPGIAREHALRLGGDATAAQIAAAALAGDAACADTLARWHSRLARALAGVVNLLDPDVIVLGGGLSRIAGTCEAVTALLGDEVFAGGVREPIRTRVVVSQHGDSSGVRGAAWLWRQPTAAA
jgi:fructokinase